MELNKKELINRVLISGLCLGAGAGIFTSILIDYTNILGNWYLSGILSAIIFVALYIHISYSY